MSSIYSLSAASTPAVHQNKAASQSFLSLDQENTHKSNASLSTPQTRHISADASKPPKTLSRGALRVRNENIQPQHAFIANSEYVGRATPKPETQARRRLSLRTLSSAASASQEHAERLPLPPPNDPVLTKAIEGSIRQSRSTSLQSQSLDDQPPKKAQPFRRWMQILHRNASRQKSVHPRTQRWSLDEFDDDQPPKKTKGTSSLQRKHRKSISWASGSSALVTAVRSARQSFSLLSETATHRTGKSGLARTSTRGSYRSHSLCRSSVDENNLASYCDDEASWARSIKRGQIIGEIIDSEESYVSDLKALSSVSETDPNVLHY